MHSILWTKSHAFGGLKYIMTIQSKIKKLKPGTSKKVLLLIAGLMWAGIGTMLDILAGSWLKNGKLNFIIFAGLIGFVCALIIHHFGFLHIVDKNLKRIDQMEGKRCIFSFISWKSYFLIAIMILMGFLLRHSNISKPYLAILYIGIGTALLLSSVRYFRYTITGKKTQIGP